MHVTSFGQSHLLAKAATTFLFEADGGRFCIVLFHANSLVKSKAKTAPIYFKEKCLGCFGQKARLAKRCDTHLPQKVEFANFVSLFWFFFMHSVGTRINWTGQSFVKWLDMNDHFGLKSGIRGVYKWPDWTNMIGMIQVLTGLGMRSTTPDTKILVQFAIQCRI